MHISEGILSAPVLAGGFVGTAILAGITLRKMDMEEIPKISVVTAAFFVASLIHVPIGITSIHLILNGLVGITLGLRSFPAIMLALVLQALLFGHGGVTVIGVNSIMLGGGGLVAYFIWQMRHRFRTTPKREPIFGGIAAALSVVFSGIILALALVTTGEEFRATAGYALLAHVPVMVIESIVVGACAGFLMKVKPDILAGHRQTGQRHAP
ncbi:MAG: cobalt transporter CbiM [Nitrospirae bacterium]|nr:cobalt transporter CbiM [Nitrospirota bacterium]